MNIELQNNDTDIIIDKDNTNISLDNENQEIEIEEENTDIEIDKKEMNLELGVFTVPSIERNHATLYNLDYIHSGHLDFFELVFFLIVSAMFVVLPSIMQSLSSPWAAVLCKHRKRGRRHSAGPSVHFISSHGRIRYLLSRIRADCSTHKLLQDQLP